MPTLHWVGKDKVVHHHHEVPFRVLNTVSSFRAPEGAPANSLDNRIIHGDNLEARTSSVASAMPSAAAASTMQVAAHDASPARNSQPRRDLVAATAQLGRHVGDQLRAIGMAGDEAQAAFPAGRRWRVVLQTHFGAALQHRLDAL